MKIYVYAIYSMRITFINDHRTINDHETENNCETINDHDSGNDDKIVMNR